MLFQATAELILASASPRRRELLTGCGLLFRAVVPDVDETPEPGEAPHALVRRLAQAKAESAARHDPGAWVIAADTIVVCEGEILGKPADREDAERMLLKLQGREHEVWGGFAVIRRSAGSGALEHSVSTVGFVPLSRAQVRAYIESGEPMDKAGAYAIQGLGAALVARVSGSYTNVVGLDLAKLFGVLERLGAVKRW